MSGSSNDQNGAGAASSNGDAAAAASYRQIISSARQIALPMIYINAWMKKSPTLSRGEKRSHSQVDNCDCDDIEVPLAKRINRLNIEQQQQMQNQQHQHQHPALHHHNHHQQHQQQHQHHVQATNFQESYPYPASSQYYEPNHLLFHLHMERAQRQQQFEGALGPGVGRQQQQGQSSRSLSPEDPASPASR